MLLCSIYSKEENDEIGCNSAWTLDPCFNFDEGFVHDTTPQHAMHHALVPAWFLLSP